MAMATELLLVDVLGFFEGCWFSVSLSLASVGRLGMVRGEFDFVYNNVVFMATHTGKAYAESDECQSRWYLRSTN